MGWCSLWYSGRFSGEPTVARPSWPAYFYGAAEWASSRASCPRASVGAVLVSRDKRVIGTGYNGAPPGERHCIDVGCSMVDGHCQRANHAEVNAIAYAARAGVSVEGAILYLWIKRDDVVSTGPPAVCRECHKVLSAAGVWVAPAL